MRAFCYSLWVWVGHWAGVNATQTLTITTNMATPSTSTIQPLWIPKRNTIKTSSVVSHFTTLKPPHALTPILILILTLTLTALLLALTFRHLLDDCCAHKSRGLNDAERPFVVLNDHTPFKSSTRRYSPLAPRHSPRTTHHSPLAIWLRLAATARSSVGFDFNSPAAASHSASVARKFCVKKCFLQF